MKEITVNSNENCLQVAQEEMDKLQNKSASATLEPGTYVLRIKDGEFSYGDSIAEPFVLIWIYGGKFINLKTNVETKATWSSLNGYDDTITLVVKENTNISGLFLDVYKQDNTGNIVISILDA
ncbi:MAG: hypothetical protein MGF17_03075 [Trichodesmium sp. MAG_R04]|nr:hypothetical protein [Trichodesmium sp. MAG_R04]